MVRQSGKTPSLTVVELRQSRAIGDLINRGQWSKALEACEKVNSTHGLLKSQQGLALVGLGRQKEAGDCAEAAGQVGGSYLYSLLRSLERWDQWVEVLEADGLDTFGAHVEARQWERAAAVALEGRHGPKRPFWALVALSRHTDTMKNGHVHFEPDLAELVDRLPEVKTEHECHALVSALCLLGRKDEALRKLSNEQGEHLCQKSLMLELLRSRWNAELGRWQSLHDAALKRLNSGDDNWQWVSDLIISSFELKQESTLKQFLIDWAKERPGARAPSLALIECYRRTGDEAELLKACQRHFSLFKTKSVCFNDLKVVAEMNSKSVSAFLQSLAGNGREIPSSSLELAEHITLLKMRQWLDQDCPVPRLFADYQTYLSFGQSLPRTELQPSDDLGLMAAQRCVILWAEIQNSACLFTATVILEVMLLRSPANFQARLLLVRCYTLLGLPQLAMAHFDKVKIRAIQHDSCFYMISMRLSNLDPNQERVKTFLTRSDAFYLSAKADLPGLISSAFENGTYSNVHDFLDLGDRLDNSVERALKWIELCGTECVTASGPGKALGQILDLLKKDEPRRLVQRAHRQGLSDNRDFALLCSFDKKSSMEELTRTGRADAETVKSFAHVYAAFGQPLDVPLGRPQEAKSAFSTDFFDHQWNLLTYLLGQLHRIPDSASTLMPELESICPDLGRIISNQIESMDKDTRFNHLVVQSISTLLKCHILVSVQPSLFSGKEYSQVLPKEDWTTLIEAVRKVIKQATSALKQVKSGLIKLMDRLKSQGLVNELVQDAVQVGVHENLARQFAQKCRLRQGETLAELLEVLKSRTK